MIGNLATVQEFGNVRENYLLLTLSLGLHQCLVGCCVPCIAISKGFFCLLSSG